MLSCLLVLPPLESMMFETLSLIWYKVLDSGNR